MNFKYKKRMAVYLIIAVFFIILDRFLKVLALNYYSERGINLLSDFFVFSLAKNYNIAFSLPLSGAWLNVLIILIIISLTYFWLILLKKRQYSQAICLTFILLGAISNLLDRLYYGYVIDFLDLKYFTVFNVADIMIVGGVMFLLQYNKKITAKTKQGGSKCLIN